MMSMVGVWETGQNRRIGAEFCKLGIWVFTTSIGLIYCSFEAAPENAATLSAAKEIFTMVLPVATGIITYWFASRRPEQDLAGPAERDNDVAGSRMTGERG